MATSQDQTLVTMVDNEDGTVDAFAVTIHDGSRWVVRRLTPVECERLQGFPTIVSLETEKMTRDELFVCALINGDVSCDVENGIVYTNRGSRGTRLKEPKKLGCKHPSGYIVFSLHFNGVRKQIRAHRAVWIAAHGLIPDGYVVDHINNDKSDNRICNLQLLTPKDNSHKAKEDGLYLTDMDHPGTKIPAYMHSVIQHDYMTGGGSYKQLAAKYGISKARIRDIIKESGYTNIPYRGREHPPDTPRYKALGNSFSVPVVRWIGERMQMVDEIMGKVSEDAV